MYRTKRTMYMHSFFLPPPLKRSHGVAMQASENTQHPSFVIPYSTNLTFLVLFLHHIQKNVIFLIINCNCDNGHNDGGIFYNCDCVIIINK